ncbi:MAG: dihydropteroate synthase [Nitrospinae bacterium]|nr:dihydropteroate synthase [Nitrospinota bacterium]
MRKARHPLVAGIINLNSDSFFGKSRCASENEALRLAESLIIEGADILDVGAESSRPGSLPISEDDEINRLLPVVKELSRRYKIPVSVDTYKPKVAQIVLDAGASIINDITGLQKYPQMADIISSFNAGVVLMHMQGSPKNMQENPVYADLLQEIISFLGKSSSIAIKSGISPESIAIDPGIGFGKTTEHNLELLGKLDSFKGLGKAILVGPSRKAFIGNILDLPVEERMEGSLAASVVAVLKGVDILRVHDVKETVRVIKITEAIRKYE